VTDEELATYYSQSLAGQSIEGMRPGFSRLARRMEATGTAGQQLALGSVAQLQADLRVLETAPDPTPHQRATAHNIRDVLAHMGLMGDRPYKG
jgi:hypothetical protein